MLTWKQRFQRWIKSHKKKANLHTKIAAILVLFITLGFNWFDRPKISPVPPSNDDLTISFVGDMMFSRYQEMISDRYGTDYFFDLVRSYFQQSDYVTGNFESAIIKGDHYPKADKLIHFGAKPQVVEAIKKAGFNCLNLANNHIKDFGKQGLSDTLKVLKKNKIHSVGAGPDLVSASKISYKKCKGIKIATLGISDIIPKEFRANKNRSGIVPADPNIFFPLLTKAKQSADLVIVHAHWGFQYDSGFHPRQKDLGHALIDAGADIVVGHSPHVLEPVEIYKNGLIFYSLGNFIFDQGWSRTKESVLAQYKVKKNGEARIELHPMFIREGRPSPVQGLAGLYRREKIYSQLTSERLYSKPWNDAWKRGNDFIYRNVGHLNSENRKEGEH